MRLLRCTVYLAVLGLLSFFLGGILPRAWFHGDRAPFASRPWEREGALYLRFGIKHWKDKLPDMSRIIPVITRKQLRDAKSIERVERLIQETCVAEAVHWFLCAAGFFSVVLWPGYGGLIIAAVWILFGNLPFILIQRYNRPRLMKLKSDLTAYKKLTERKDSDESIDLDLQYGGRT